MPYKKKLKVLLSLIAALFVVYIASFIFDPQMAASRSSAYVWLDAKLASRAVKIIINASGAAAELVKRNGQWFVSHNGNEYPARQTRVDDFISIFTKRSPWSVRSTSASSHERLGLNEDAASRVTIYGENTALLDILLGMEDSTGSEIYFRKAGQNEVRSGENKIAQYLSGSADAWYNLKFIPEADDGKLTVDRVQRLSVYTQEQQIFSRKNKQWEASGFKVENLNQSFVSAYVETVLNSEGEGFEDSILADDPMFGKNSITLEFDNGTVKTIRLSEPDEAGKRFVNVAGSAYVYSMSSWAAQRLFKTSVDFEAN